jgi:hypothetical protein
MKKGTCHAERREASAVLFENKQKQIPLPHCGIGMTIVAGFSSAC